MRLNNKWISQILLLGLLNTMQAQVLDYEKAIKLPLFLNQKIDYCVGNFTNGYTIPDTEIGYRINYINYLKDTILFNQIKQIEKQEWLKLLENNNSDFATTIILYYLLNESAITYGTLYTENDFKDLNFWRFSFKGKEVEKLKNLLDTKSFRKEMCCKYSHTTVYCSAEHKLTKTKLRKSRKKKPKKSSSVKRKI